LGIICQVDLLILVNDKMMILHIVKSNNLYLTIC